MADKRERALDLLVEMKGGGYVDPARADKREQDLETLTWLIRHLGPKIAGEVKPEVLAVASADEDGEYEYTTDAAVWKLAIDDGSQNVWVIADTPAQAMAEAEGMDYLEEFRYDGEASVRVTKLQPDEFLSVWMCDSRRDDIDGPLQPFLEEEDEDEEWSTVTVRAPAAIWASTLGKTAMLLADSEASC